MGRWLPVLVLAVGCGRRASPEATVTLDGVTVTLPEGARLIDDSSPRVRTYALPTGATLAIDDETEVPAVRCQDVLETAARGATRDVAGRRAVELVLSAKNRSLSFCLDDRVFSITILAGGDALTDADLAAYERAIASLRP